MLIEDDAEGMTGSEASSYLLMYIIIMCKVGNYVLLA